MTQEMAKKLVDSELGRELVQFLASECLQLNTLDGIEMKEKGAWGVAVEVTARKLALDTLKRILDPLILARDYAKIIGVSKDEYVA